MMRIEASLTKVSALRLRHSQSLASLRHRPSQAKVRSTIQRLGRTTKRWTLAEGRFVAYYRVSTEKQGRSGLGLEAQRGAVEAFLNGGSWKLVAEFTEIESGKRADRPKLAEAVKAAKKHKATLVIAKLDRL
jgi:hypothetical protein